MAPLIGYASSSSMTFRTIGPAHGVYNFALATSQRVRVRTFRAFWAFLMSLYGSLCYFFEALDRPDRLESWNTFEPWSNTRLAI